MSNGKETENMELVSCKKFIRIWWLVIESVFLAIAMIPFLIGLPIFFIGVTSALITDYKSIIVCDEAGIILSLILYIAVPIFFYIVISSLIKNLFGREEIYIDEEKLIVKMHALIFHKTESIKLTDIIDITFNSGWPITNYGSFIVAHRNILKVNIYLSGKFLFWHRRKHCGVNYNKDETRYLIEKIYEKRGSRRQSNSA